MDDVDDMVVGVRADTAAFARDVAAMRKEIDGPLQAGADRAGRALESALLRAVRGGKAGFADLRQVALSALGEIAAEALHGGIGAVLGGGVAKGGGAGGLLSALVGLFDRPGRATGGAVAPGRPYWVGERGPELFVPGSAGEVRAPVAAGGGRDVQVAITINAGAGDAAGAMARSGRQVARAVRAALQEA